MNPKQRIRVIPPPIFFLAFLLIGTLAHNRWPVAIAPYPFRAGLMAGTVMLVIAASLGAWAIAEVLRHKTTIEPGHQPDHLVVSGPYRFTRNPMYVALVLVTAAVAVMLDSMWVLGAAVFLLVVLDRAVIAGEERLVEGVFGDAYLAYKKRVRRWV